MHESAKFDPEKVHEAYESLRSFLISDAENKFKSPSRKFGHLPERKLRSYLFECSGLNPEKMRAIEKEDSETFKNYIDSVVRAEARRYSEEAESILLDRLDPRLLDRSIIRPIPYSVLLVASDGKSLDQVQGYTEVHNPWAEKLAPNNWLKQQKRKLDLSDEGNGLEALFWPKCNMYQGCSAVWVFYFEPKSEDAYGPAPTPAEALFQGKFSKYYWTCDPLIMFNGYVAGFVDDGAFSSLYASLLVEAECILVPAMGKYQHYPFGGMPGTAMKESKRIIDWSGQNWNFGKLLNYQQAAYSLHLGPYPWDVFKPHWIICRVNLIGEARGDSYVLADFESGNYGIYCFDVYIQEQFFR